MGAGNAKLGPILTRATEEVTPLGEPRAQVIFVGVLDEHVRVLVRYVLLGVRRRGNSSTSALHECQDWVLNVYAELVDHSSSSLPVMGCTGQSPPVHHP